MLLTYQEIVLLLMFFQVSAEYLLISETSAVAFTVAGVFKEVVMVLVSTNRVKWIGVFCSGNEWKMEICGVTAVYTPP